MSDDILSRIDEIVEAATSCLCGCQKALRGGGDSPWFASEECQAAWNARRVAGDRKSSIERVPVPASAPATVAEAVIRRMSRPHAASPWLTREDITGQRDRINDALRAEVRRQGLDEETIRIEAIRPVRLADPPDPWVPLPDDGPWRSFEVDPAAFRREYLNERVEATRPAPDMSEALRPVCRAHAPRRWWQWRPW